MRILTFVLLSMCLSTVAADDRYNPMTNEWETATPDESLRFNPMANDWSYEKKDADLEYQPMQNKWDYEQDDQDE